METLLYLLESLGAATLTTLWLPVAVWTLISLPVFLLLRAWKTAHPFVQYVTHVVLLLTLPVGLLVAAVVDLSVGPAWSLAPVTPPVPLPAGAAAGSDSAAAGSLGMLHLVALLTIVAFLQASWQTARLAAHAWTLRRFRRHHSGIDHPDVQQRAEEIRRAMHIRRPVRTVVTSRDVVPMTFGWRRPLIVLPAALAADDEPLTMVLTHELVHVRRRDYLLQWVEQVVGALFFVHPLVALLRHAIGAYREMTCDADVLAHAPFDRGRYARLLYRYLLPPQTAAPLVLGMATGHEDFKARLLALKSYSRTSRRHLRTRATAFTAAGLLAGLCLVAVACTDVIDVNITIHPRAEEEATPAARAAPETGSNDASTFVIVEQMPELVGGLAAIQQELRYPEIAKNAGIEGRVFVQFVVDERGRVVDPVVVRGIGGGCDEEALRAVRTVTFKPGRQQGEPVRVRMSLPITFRLGSG